MGGTQGVFLSPAVPGDADSVTSASHAGLRLTRSGCDLTAVWKVADPARSLRAVLQSTGSAAQPRGPDSRPRATGVAAPCRVSPKESDHSWLLLGTQKERRKPLRPTASETS